MLARKKLVMAPFPGLPAPANPVYLPCLREPVVPLEWRRETIKWDNRQLRSQIDTHRKLWRSYNFYKDCLSCKETAQALTSGKYHLEYNEEQ